MLTLKFALYAIALLCAAVAMFVGGVVLPHDTQAGAVIIFGGSAMLSCLALWLAWRRDRVAFARFAAVMSLLSALIAVTVLIEWDSIVPGAVLVVAAAALAGAWSGAWLWRYYRAHDPVPDLLRDLFEEPLLMERLDVQLVYFVSATRLPPLGTLEARVYLQNCCNGPRRIQLSFSPERPLWDPDRGSLRVPPPASFELHAAEAGYVTVPIQASEEASGRFNLWLRVSVRGSGGDRIRKRRARELSVRWSWWFRILGLLGGHLLLGGGAKARIEIARDAPPGTADPTEGARWHRLYPPEPAP